jgi:LysM repeat protein
MARKVFIFLLLIAGWGVIFYPLMAKPTALRWPFGAHPADNLPQPWKSGAVVQMEPQSAAAGAANSTDSAGASTCPAEYTIQPGESLGVIARRCAVTLQSLLAANPQISNPNRVNAGLSVTIPVLGGRGGGDDLEQSVSLGGGYTPGADISIQAAGLPAGAPVSVGIGLSSSGYRVLRRAVSGQDGSLSLTITIPGNAQPGERMFILITTSGVPSVQAISPEVQIQ